MSMYHDCPECAQGKHQNCTQTVPDEHWEVWAECPCKQDGHPIPIPQEEQAVSDGPMIDQKVEPSEPERDDPPSKGEGAFERFWRDQEQTTGTQLTWEETADHPVKGVTLSPGAMEAGKTYSVRISTGVGSESVYEPWPGEVDTTGLVDEHDEQERRVWALKEARGILETIAPRGPLTGPGRTPPTVKNLLRVATFILDGAETVDI